MPGALTGGVLSTELEVPSIRTVTDLDRGWQVCVHPSRLGHRAPSPGPHRWQQFSEVEPGNPRLGTPDLDDILHSLSFLSHLLFPCLSWGSALTLYMVKLGFIFFSTDIL